MSSKNPALVVAHIARKETSGFVTLSTGIQARLVPVATALLESAKQSIEQPQPPMWFNKEKEREEPNYADPNFVQSCERAEEKRGMAILDTLVMFGVELIDDIPEDGQWLKKLRKMEKMGLLDLSSYDFDDDLDVEFLYKKHIAMATPDYQLVAEMCGVSEGGITKAAEPFPGKA